MIEALIIMTEEENAAAALLNTSLARVEGRIVDNPLANNLGEGVLVGKYLAPARLLNDELFVGWVATLGLLPIRTFDTDTVYIPEIPWW